ncbi:MAG TPA: UvrD-helicase domain-containing protein, partial [Thermoanaerobaculia bacterium]|nr:UvrD-helicase domain-containing protein [Thermoanaerobaculia bacterium]
MKPIVAAGAREADREARRAAQSQFTRPLVIEAGAGTGKTTTLVARALAWSLGPGWERAREAVSSASGETPADDRIAAQALSGIVAITFTEAAAAEMAGRVARGLAMMAGNAGNGGSAEAAELPAGLDPLLLPPPAERRRRARALVGTLDHLAVRTIHAFCRGLLATFPLEAGLHPNLTVDADGRILEATVREAVESSLRDAYGDPGDADFLALAACGYGPPEILEALMVLAGEGLPAAALAGDPFAPEGLAAWKRRLAAAAVALHRPLAARLRAGGRRQNAHFIESGLAVLIARLEAEALNLADLPRLRGWLEEALPGRLADHVKKWGKGKLTSKAEKELLGEVGDEIAAAAGALCRLLDHVERLDPELLGHARRALAPLLARVERDLRARGAATFNALLAGAAALLTRHPEVRARVRRGIDQLLVDEFQDTDRLQCEILRLLALDGPLEERPGLFLVGDPKQSIYGWRSADLAAYDGFVAHAVAAGGEVRSLAENFRSVPAILAEVSRVMAPAMRQRAGLQPRFEPLLPCEERSADAGFLRPGGAGGRPRHAVEYWVSWKMEGDAAASGPRTRPGEAAELEAAALAADLRDLHAEHGVAWKEIGVLLRSLGYLETYLEALRRAGIPFRVGRDRQYYRRREVIEAAALVRAVLDPGDHLALLTVLRSPLVGVPDAALVPLWRHRFPRLLTELSRPRAASLDRLRRVIAEAAREVPADVPGLDRI